MVIIVDMRRVIDIDIDKDGKEVSHIVARGREIDKIRK